MEGDGKGFAHLGKGELTIFPGEGIGGIGCRLSVSSLLESGVFSSPFEEVLVGTVQVAQGLLNGDRGDIREPWMLLLQSGKHSREVVIGQLLTMLAIGCFAGAEPPIIHEAATSERLRKDTLLFVGRIEPILVCPLRFAHRLLPFTSIDISYHTCQYTNIHHTGEDSEHFFMRKGVPLCPSPIKGLAIHPHV